ALGEQLVDLGEVGAQLQGTLERGHSLVVLPGFHEATAEPVVAEHLLRVVLRHLAELVDALLQLAHGSTPWSVASRPWSVVKGNGPRTTDKVTSVPAPESAA